MKIFAFAVYSYHQHCKSNSMAVYVTQTTDFLPELLSYPLKELCPPLRPGPSSFSWGASSCRAARSGSAWARPWWGSCTAGARWAWWLPSPSPGHTWDTTPFMIYLFHYCPFKHTPLTQVCKSCSAKPLKYYPAVGSLLDGSLKLINMLCCNTELLSQNLPWSDLLLKEIT